MVDWLEIKLIKYGYSGRVSDLIKYSGSLEAFIWYWENFLEKILLNSKGFYGGGFIRFKVKNEAMKKYLKHKKETSLTAKSKLTDKQTTKEHSSKKEIEKKQLNSWFVKYSLVNESYQKIDLEKYIWNSGQFDYLPEYNRRKFFNETMFPSNLTDHYKSLFKGFITKTKDHII